MIATESSQPNTLPAFAVRPSTSREKGRSTETTFPFPPGFHVRQRKRPKPTSSILGWLAEKPELSHTQSGRLMVNFSLVTEHTYRDRCARLQKRTAWLRVKAFGIVAKMANEYLKKDSRIYVHGRLIVRNWTDQRGDLHTFTQVIARDFLFLDSVWCKGNEAILNAEATTAPSSVPNGIRT